MVVRPSNIPTVVRAIVHTGRQLEQRQLEHRQLDYRRLGGRLLEHCWLERR